MDALNFNRIFRLNAPCTFRPAANERHVQASPELRSRSRCVLAEPRAQCQPRPFEAFTRISRIAARDGKSGNSFLGVDLSSESRCCTLLPGPVANAFFSPRQRQS